MSTSCYILKGFSVFFHPQVWVWWYSLLMFSLSWLLPRLLSLSPLPLLFLVSECCYPFLHLLCLFFHGFLSPLLWGALVFSLWICFSSCLSLFFFVITAHLAAETYNFSPCILVYSLLCSHRISLVSIYFEYCLLLCNLHIFSCLLSCGIPYSRDRSIPYNSAEALCNFCKVPSCFFRTFWGVQIGGTFHIK